MKRLLAAAAFLVAFQQGGEASACSLIARDHPLRASQAEIDAIARRLLSAPGATIVEATVVRATGGRRPGLLRVERVLRGSAPATLEVSSPICGYGFYNLNERGIATVGGRRTGFLHRQIEEAVRRLAAAE